MLGNMAHDVGGVALLHAALPAHLADLFCQSFPLHASTRAATVVGGLGGYPICPLSPALAFL